MNIFLNFYFGNQQKLLRRKLMIPSPASSLSSFRDYYHHTSDNQSYSINEEISITVGLRNFKLVKLLVKLNKKINKNNYWLMFEAFRKINKNNNAREKRLIAQKTFKKVLQNIVNKDSKLTIKCNYTHFLLKYMQQRRNLELNQIMAFGLKFIKKNYINYILAYQKLKLVNNDENESKDKPNKQKIKYLKKLSKATLCILFRNISQTKLSIIFQFIKSAYLLRTNKDSNSIKFFKPKKEKHVYVHKRNDYISKLNHLLYIVTILNKKVYANYSWFWNNICLQKKFYKVIDSKQDDPQIWMHAVKHMVYLNNKKMQKLNNNQFNQINEIRALKLQSILKQSWRRQKNCIYEYLFYWRKITNDEHLRLRKQIIKLQQIKLHYMDQY